MLTLTIENSNSFIQGLSREEHKSLGEALSMTSEVFGGFLVTPSHNLVLRGIVRTFDSRGTPTVVFDVNTMRPVKSLDKAKILAKKRKLLAKGWHESSISLLSKNGSFPTGLLPRVYSWLGDSEVSVIDTRVVPPALKAFPNASLRVTPYPEQTNAATAAVGANRGIVVAPTGVGKTLITALIVAMLRVKTLIVVPTLALKRQTAYAMTEVFGPAAPITVENVDALDTSRPAKGYDCVIIDEFHRSAAATYRNLNKNAWNGIFYRFGLTATPFRSKAEENLLLESIISEEVYRIHYLDAVENGYIVPVEAFYVNVRETECHASTWPKVYSQLVVENELRNRLIANTAKAFDCPTLILVREIEHGLKLQKLLPGTPFAKGENEDNSQLIEDFNSGKVKRMIGTVGVLGEGVDTRPAEVIIIAGLGKSKNQFMQQVGRGVRRHGAKTTCKVILFRDQSHRFTLSHFEKQCQFLEDEYHIDAQELKL